MYDTEQKIWTGKRARRVEPLSEIQGDGPREVPSSSEAERHVIGCCLVEGSDTIAQCLAAKISGEAFFTHAHRVIFELIVELYRARPPVTLDMIAEELRTRRALDSVGGPMGLMEITGGIPTTSHAAYFIQKLKEKWMLRELIKSATKAVEECYAYAGGSENSVEDLILPLAARFNRAAEYARAGEETMQQAADRGYARTLQKLENKHDRSLQIFTGLADFDKRFGAFDVFEEDWFNGIGACTSGGKSAFARKVADYNSQQGKKGVVFLLETSIAKYLDLSACTAAGVNGRLLEQLPKDLAEKFREERAKRQAWVGERLWIYDDKPPIETIIGRIDDHVRQHGLPDFVVIDHLHECTSTHDFRGNRVSELGYIAKLIKKTAKRMNRPFFVPIQFNRSPNKDGESRRPTKHDLRGSGEIEAAVDRLILLHTPKTDINGAEQTDNQHRVMIEVIQDKSRNGPIGHREFWFVRPYTDYVPLRDAEFQKRAGTPGGAKSAGGYGRQ